MYNERLIQVTNVDGQFVPAKPMKGAVLVNIDDLMQRWTSDRYKSVVSLNNKLQTNLDPSIKKYATSHDWLICTL